MKRNLRPLVSWATSVVGLLTLWLPGRAAISACDVPRFHAAVEITPPAQFATAVAVGDLNGDGKPDIAIATGEGPSHIWVGLGNADGTFVWAGNYAVGYDDYDIVLADVNGDNRLDLVTANFDSSSASVLLGNGDGTFQTAIAAATGQNPGSVKVADVNGDGKPDIVTGNQGFGGAQPSGHTVSVLLGNGDGTFQPKVDYTCGATPSFVDVADVNGDGHPDIVTANDSNPGSVSVLLGNGDGTYRPKVDYSTAIGATVVAIADVNGDGKPDIVAGSDAGADSVLLGNGDGTFMPKVDYPAGKSPYGMALVDVDGDGKRDIVTSNFGSGTVSVLLGNGDGTFIPHSDFRVGSTPTTLAVADIDDDGKLDVVTANEYQGNPATACLLFGNGDGTFVTDTRYTVGLGPQSVTAADLNGDGKSDIVTGNSGNGTGASVSVLLGIGDGTFAAHAEFGTAAGPAAVTVADINGDRKLDIITANKSANTISMLAGNGDGTFQNHVDADVGASPTGIAVGDVNGDGTPDVVTANGSANTVSILLGKGGGTFQTPTTDPAGGAGVILADVNGDGKPDIITSSVCVLLGNGDGSFQPAVNYQTYGSAVAVADLNGDGFPDIATVGPTLGLCVLLGKGSGAFGSAVRYNAGVNPEYIAISDVNGDNVPDLATNNPSTITVDTATAVPISTTSVLLGNGDGTFRTRMQYGPYEHSTGLVVADVNGDGGPDIIVANNPLGSAGAVSVLLNLCPDTIVTFTALDAARALQEAAGLINALPSDVIRYDLAFDHHITIADAVQIARRVAGL